MISRELIKAKIDKVKETDLVLLHKIIEAIISTETAETGPGSASQIDLAPELQQRQAQLVGKARQLQTRLGDPVDELAEFWNDLPPEDDEFWRQIVEAVD